MLSGTAEIISVNDELRAIHETVPDWVYPPSVIRWQLKSIQFSNDSRILLGRNADNFRGQTINTLAISTQLTAEQLANATQVLVPAVFPATNEILQFA